jgi:hypothetical protein
MRRFESAQAGQVTMLDRMAMYENILKVLIAQQKEELGRLEEGQRQILRQFEEVKKIIGTTAGQEVVVNTREQQRKDLLVRLFGWHW